MVQNRKVPTAQEVADQDFKSSNPPYRSFTSENARKLYELGWDDGMAAQQQARFALEQASKLSGGSSAVLEAAQAYLTFLVGKLP